MRWLGLALVLLLAGCGGGGPKTQFYALVPVGSSGHAAFAAPGRLPLEVGDVHLPPALDRGALVVTGPGTSVSVSNNEQWAAPLGGMIRDTLTADLRERLGEGRVIAPSDPAPPGGVRTVVVTLQRFSADQAGHVVLAADWTLTHGSPPRPGVIRHVRLTEDAGSTAGGAVAAAMSRTLGQLADRIAAG
jgi:hypothetical protein